MQDNLIKHRDYIQENGTDMPEVKGWKWKADLSVPAMKNRNKDDTLEVLCSGIRAKTRTLRHNLQIASLLSFVAGAVNVTGFLAVQRLTTNVTGHFAFFVDEVFKLHVGQALVYLSYILFFLAGSFFSSFLIELISRRNELSIYIIPVSVEIVILFTIGMLPKTVMITEPDAIACSLLFAMGVQNSLVTRISNAAVRTTHLTGLFTDLGIELSQLFFYKQREQRKKLLSSIRLRLTIIFFFFTGGIVSGILYTRFGLRLLVFVAVFFSFRVGI